VHYAGDARVYGDMVSSEAASRSQRRRWEGGRWAIARTHVAPLVVQGIRRGDPVLLDLAADLMVPPLTYVAAAALVGAAGSVGWLLLGHIGRGHHGAYGAWWAVAPWCAALAALAVYVMRGVWLARTGPRAILDLLWVPIYMIWKIFLAVRASPAREREWVRTAREGDKP
jgi:hypothetical protein